MSELDPAAAWRALPKNLQTELRADPTQPLSDDLLRRFGQIVDDHDLPVYWRPDPESAYSARGIHRHTLTILNWIAANWRRKPGGAREKHMDLEQEELTPWTQTQLDAVVRDVGSLPDDYRDFVLRIGTGDVRLHLFPRADAVADKFLDASDIVGRGGGFDGWIRDTYIPVVRGNGGALAIRLSDGKVFFADYDKGAAMGLDDESSEDIMREYAQSWSEVVQQIPSWKLV
ncbi:hypothetical protein BKG69_06490 [Mycobacteroides chelonae]|uniref:SMI1/KNR4 family protein n=1 Tax=Mycobacteroides chelonae TaxID=1774 RepID=UPI0008A9BC2B|nr:SMI1/KNR4 family protein [Mycobacteroides chelonae]OHT80549.1 hypothetical protein BKG69_06490 [Mycobacteroides chelonae]GLE55936.1 hypothetical protein NJBCHELONAE_12440 [Mycobacteroides chelonae]